jgi:signal peptide peptidase SppA
MQNYGQIISKITTTPWMMMPNALQTMLEIVEAHLSGSVSVEQLQQRDTRAKPAPRQGAVGVLPLHGPIFPKANMMTEMSGATSLEMWTQEFLQMVNDDSIGAILLDIDSPGGSSAMIPETAQMIREARSVKPIYAVANTMAGSAAYGLASQASQLFASPSSVVGSIGTYMVHTDRSGLAEKVGVKETVIKAGRFKAVDLESLTPEAKQYMEELVGDINDVFINEIALGRNVEPDVIRGTEARIYAPHKSVEAGLADGVASFDEVLSDLVAQSGGGQQATVPSITSFTGTEGSMWYSFTPRPTASYDADKEHSEPGTGLGGEPTPREAPEEGDPAIEGGWRRDPPPPAYETEEAVNREWLIQQATTLGVEFDEDTTDEQLAELVATRMQEIVVPLNQATEQAVRERQFEVDYPEQASMLQELARREREGAASAFASQYERFEGQPRGFAPAVRDQIEQAHARIGARQFTHSDLGELLDAVASQAAIVTYGEVGSSRMQSTDVASGDVVTGDFTVDRQRFTELVREAMTQDNLDQTAAIAHVSQTHPQLATAYMQGHTRR